MKKENDFIPLEDIGKLKTYDGGSPFHKCSCGKECYGPTIAKEELDKLRKRYNEILEPINRGSISHPVPYLAYEFSKLLESFSHQANLIFVHSKYCKEHDPDIKAIKRKGEVLAQAIRDLNANKNYPNDFENLSQALSIWEGTQ